MVTKTNTLAKEFYNKNHVRSIKRNTLADEFYSKYKNRGSNIGYVAANVGIGLAGIFEGLGDFVGGTYYQLIGDKDYAKYLHMNDVTGGWKERLDKNFNPSSTVKVLGDISSGIGQAIPTVALGVATGGGSLAVQAAGAAAMGAAYAGRGVTSAVQQTGELGFKENAYGVLSGSLEGVTDMFLGGTVKAGKALVTTARQSAKVGAKKIARTTLLKGTLSAAASEAAEEFIQEYADTALLRLTGVNKEAEYSFGNAAYSAFIGGVTGEFLGGVTNGINTGVNLKIGQDLQQRGLAEQVLNTADYVRDVHIGNSKNYSNITSKSLRALTASVDAYRGLNAEAKAGTKGAVILGEIKQELLAFESAAGVDAIKTRMMDGDEQTRKAFATEASKLFGKQISAEDIKTNAGGITERLALESFVSGALADNQMETSRAQMNEAIAAERLPYLNSSEAWNGEGAAAYRDPKSGKYIFVHQSEDGNWRMAYSPTAIYDENNLMVKDGISTEDVKKTLAGLRDGSMEIGDNSISVHKESKVDDKTHNHTQTPKKMYDIVVLDDGKTYVKASRNVITGNTLAEKRSNITQFFNDLIGNDGSLDVTTIDGETLTITKNETAYKARDDYREENGKRVALSDSEFLVKLHAEAHVDELAETATKTSKPLTPDSKNHNFAKDGFEYKSVYFQDFDGKYYKITLSVGHNGTTATVYNVGRIKEGVLPSAKVIAVRGSIGPWNTPSGNSISQNSQKSTQNGKKVDRKSLADGEGVATDTAQEARESSQTGEEFENEQVSANEAQRATERESASERAVPDTSNMTENERERGYTDKEADTARKILRDFDMLSREKRLAIIEMMRSAKACDASESFMRHAASMIGYWRKGLYILADSKTSEKGFYQAFGDGSRLIVVNPTKAKSGTKAGAKNAIDTAFVHELAHDIWEKATAKTKDALYRLATEGATAAEVEDIRTEYEDGYKARGLKYNEELLREEVFTNLMGKTLGNERFLERFDITPGRMTAFKRGIKAVTRMAKCFVGKDRYLYSRCEKMARAFIRAMGEEMAFEAVGNGDSPKYIRYSTMNEISFEENIKNILRMEDSEALKNKEEGNFVKISNNTPQFILEKVKSAKDLQLIIRFDALYLALRRNGALQGHYHNLGPEILNNLVDYLEKPDAIVVRKDGRLTVVSSFSNNKGKNGIISVELDTVKDINSKNDNYNLVVTVFTSKDNYLKNSLLKYGEHVAYEKEDLSQVNPQLHEWLATINDKSSDNSIAENPEMSTPSAKKMFSLGENNSTRNDNFDADEFLRKAMENGGMIEKAVETEVKAGEAATVEESVKAGEAVKVEEAKSQTAGKKKAKAKTKKQLQAENKELKADNRTLTKTNEKLASGVTKAQGRASELSAQNQQLKKENAKAKRVAENADKMVAAEKSRIAKEAAMESRKNAKLIKEVALAVEFLKNEVTHRKYTEGGTVGAAVLADPGIRAFANFFAKKSSAYNIMNKSTRVACDLLLEFYNPNNPIFADGNENLFWGEESKNIFSSYRPEVAAMIEGIANGEGDLSISELRQFGDVLKNVRHIYEHYDSLNYNGKRESAKVLAARGYESQIAARSVLETTYEDGEPKLKRFFRMFKESYLYTVVTPEEVLRDLECHVKDPVLSTLYREVRLGEARAGKIRAEILTPITEFLSQKENKDFYKRLKTADVEFGKVTITLSQAIGIYETSKREHAQERMYDPDNGIRIFDHASGKMRTVRVKKDMVDKLYASFDETTRTYIKHLEDAMAACKKYKVDTDIEVMGFTNAIDGHYYPITTDPGYFSKDITDVRRAMELGEIVKDKGFNKNTVQGAQAPLFIEDSQLVLERHVGGISQYAGLYIPLQNFGKVYGAKIDPSIPAEEQGRDNGIDLLNEATKLVKKTSLNEYYNNEVWNGKGKKNGKNLNSYLTKLFSDIQRIKTGETSIIDKGVEALRSGYVNSVFGLNPKIIMTQLAAYPAASRIIDADCLAGAFGRNPLSKENFEAMDKHSLLTLSRQFEGVSAAEGLVEKLSELGKKTSVGIELTDRGTIAFLYTACQLQVAKDGGAEVGSDANLKAAAEMLDNVLLDTQTTSLLADRSALARDKNEFAKMLSMFRNESVKAFSNFYGAISSYVDHKKLAETDASYNELLDTDKKKIARNAGAYVASSAVVAAVSIAFSKLYAIGKDDEEKEKLGKMIAVESAEAVFDLFPIFSDVAGFMIDGYDLNSLPLEVVNDLLSSLRGIGTIIDTEATRAEKAKYLRNTAYTVGSVLGLPAKNAAKLTRTTVAIFNKPLAYKWANKADTSPSYKSDLEKALDKGNERLAQTIMTLWVSDKMTGDASVAAVNELTRLYVLEGADGKSLLSMPKNAPSSLTASEREKFISVYAGADGAMLSLLNSSAYAKLDDAGKAGAVKACYDLYYVRAQEACGLEVSESGMRVSAAESQLDADILYTVIGYAKTLSGDSKKAQIVKLLIELGVPLNTRKLYLEALGYKS